MTDHNDQHLAQLMEQAQAGDRRAYADLLSAITPTLRGFISSRLGKQADVEDIVQNILIAIHRAGRTYDSRRPFKMWMFAIARYCLNDHLRHLYKKGVLPDISLNDLTDELAAADSEPDRDRREYLQRLLDTLPERQKRIVTMMKIEGHSIGHTAKTMKMSPSAVKVAAHRAYKALIMKSEELQADDLREEGRHGNG